MNVPLSVIPASPPPPPAAEARAAGRGGTLRDAHGRRIHDLRLSVTDRCNYRCVYCMDPDFRYLPKQALLSLEAYLDIAAACVELGIRKVRITGGEPTLYPMLDPLIEGLAKLGLDDIAMTTNGSLTNVDNARRWADLGLNRVTFSLDSVRPERVRAITRATTGPETVIGAIRACRAAGLDPIKVNAVIIRGTNDDELADLASFAREHAVDVRLIEFMPLDSSRAWDRSHVVPADEMLERIRAAHDLVPVGDADPSSTSVNFTFPDGCGRIGVIAPVSRPFCGACNRLRITADGKVRPCLFSTQEWDLGPVVRGGGDRAAIGDFIADAVWTKQAGHGIGSDDFQPPARTMSAIGG
ncbi:MAG: GTP 3',8-cyclase MoaA [Planctomycetota bacterium]|jgi:cyclic pyranopterin phosphate synthase